MDPKLSSFYPAGSNQNCAVFEAQILIPETLSNIFKITKKKIFCYDVTSWRGPTLRLAPARQTVQCCNGCELLVICVNLTRLELKFCLSQNVLKILSCNFSAVFEFNYHIFSRFTCPEIAVFLPVLFFFFFLLTHVEIRAFSQFKALISA